MNAKQGSECPAKQSGCYADSAVYDGKEPFIPWLRSDLGESCRDDYQ